MTFLFSTHTVECRNEHYPLLNNWLASRDAMDMTFQNNIVPVLTEIISDYQLVSDDLVGC